MRLYKITPLIFLTTFVFCAASLFAQPQMQEEVSYKSFKLEKADCDTAIQYTRAPRGIDIGVSAIATGKGADFRKWSIADIKLHIDDESIPPDQSDKFYVKRESLFRIPAAVLFAALGTQITGSGNSLEKGITAAGMAVGLGLLVWQAKGEITGQRCIFHLDKDAARKAFSGKNFAEIRLENTEEHWQDTVKIGIAKPLFKSDNKDKYDKMSTSDLKSMIDGLGGRVESLEKEQASYKYGVNPEYDRIQSEIEDLQTQRGIAYKVWFKKEQGER